MAVKTPLHFGEDQRCESREYSLRIPSQALSDFQHAIQSDPVLKVVHWQSRHIIYLKRDCFVRQAISTLIGEARGKWTFSSSPSPDDRVSIPTESLRPYIEGRLQQLRSEEDALSHLQTLELVYESDLLNSFDHQTAANKVFRFLGLPDAPVHASTVKVGTDQLADVLANASEVEEELSRLGYSIESRWSRRQ